MFGRFCLKETMFRFISQNNVEESQHGNVDLMDTVLKVNSTCRRACAHTHSASKPSISTMDSGHPTENLSVLLQLACQQSLLCSLGEIDEVHAGGGSLSVKGLDRSAMLHRGGFTNRILTVNTRVNKNWINRLCHYSVSFTEVFYSFVIVIFLRALL